MQALKVSPALKLISLKLSIVLIDAMSSTAHKDWAERYREGCTRAPFVMQLRIPRCHDFTKTNQYLRNDDGLQFIIAFVDVDT